MSRTKLLLTCVFVLLAAAGAGLVLFASLGDASVVAATGGVDGALERAGQHDNAALRNDLYGVVMHLQAPWAMVQTAGLVVLAASAAGLVIALRSRA